ncbi:SHOCT domain-containing protein [Streptomyces sp. NPDC046316]|uniref:SHOCT domain-containing protein n=1 Tax=Streptomyces sp. NPDC046316 TaxID=3154494 RepID=UPI0033D9C90E
MTMVVGVVMLVAGISLSLALLGAMAANGVAAPLVAAIVGSVLVVAITLAVSLRRTGRRDSWQSDFRAYVQKTAREAATADELARLAMLKTKGDITEEEFRRFRSAYKGESRRNHHDS